MESVMSDGLSISAVAFRPPEPNSNQSRLPPSTEIVDNSVNELAEATFISPVAELDVDTSLVLFQFRDTATGDVTRQFPSDSQIASYQNGTALSPTEISRFFAASGPTDQSVAAEQRANIVDALQSGPDVAQIDTPETDIEPSAASVSQAGLSTDIAGDTSAATDTPAVPVTQTVASGQPNNGVSDVTDTDTGTDASAVGEGEVRTLAKSS
jgi:hypothetical protein